MTTPTKPQATAGGVPLTERAEIAKRMRQSYEVTGDKWFLRAADALASPPPPELRAGGVTEEEIGGQIARIEIALTIALDQVEGDGLPPDWDYLRLVRDQLPEFARAILALHSRQDVAQWMMYRGYATGHGDTIEDMLCELEAQAKEHASPPPPEERLDGIIIGEPAFGRTPPAESSTGLDPKTVEACAKVAKDWLTGCWRVADHCAFDVEAAIRSLVRKDGQ